MSNGIFAGGESVASSEAGEMPGMYLTSCIGLWPSSVMFRERTSVLVKVP